ncbi:MAG: hypothetical protein LBN39_10675 [Planctomycetaceae bacterium]|jgi:GTPase SAR1 family protein|nr:hypothetical protein [Planctomycetaceae bacterium]
MTEFPTLKIAMVGPRGVGKTSVLVSMYDELEEELADYGCNFVAENRTARMLNEQRRILTTTASGRKLRMNNKVGIKASTELREYDFSLNITGNKGATLNLQFVDMPGEWYLKSDSKMVDVLSQSRASLWVIDATALMEDDGDYNSSINEPKSIYNAFKMAFKDRDSGRHDIIMVLARAETYLQQDRNGNNRREELLQKLSHTYKDHIKRLRSQLKDNFDDLIDVCCVETMGNAYFSHFKDADTENPQAEFILDTKKGYAPNGCSRPLRAALLLTLAHALGIAKKGFSMKKIGYDGKHFARELRGTIMQAHRRREPWWETLLRMFGGVPLSDAIAEAICKMAERIKDDDYSEI